MRATVGLGFFLLLGMGMASPAPAQEKLEDSERKIYLETVGLLAASQVYQGYLNVGLVADGKASGTYPEKQGRQILESLVALLKASDANLDKIAKLELTKDDRAALTNLKKLNSLVRRQAVMIQEYWRTNNKGYSDGYERLRKEAWEGISKLLKLNQ